VTDIFPPLPPLDPSEAKTMRVETARDPVSAMRRDAEEGLAPGTVVAGRYLLKGELGRGGMGIVYKAFDRKLERRVALKVLRKALLLDGDHLERFEAEAKVTARLQHPAILPVYEVGHDDGRTFYTMKIVEGRCLVDLAEQGWREEVPSTESPADRWSLARALSVVGQVCRAVAYAHGHGVLHRDLKPGNVMVGRYGEVHVLDWGLAKVVGGPATTPMEVPDEVEHFGSPADETMAPGEAATLRVLTNVGEIVGTPAYMAPEQATGQPLDARADVYALGGLLYTVLCGHLPHEGTTSEVMLRLSRGVLPPPPSAHRKEVPAALDALVLRAMAPDLAERFPSAEDLADALEGWLEGRSPMTAVRAQDAEFVRAYRPSEFRRPSVTVDVALVHARSVAGEGAPPLVFLQLRARPPYLGCWALPGSFLRMEEPLEEAARRVLTNEAGVADPGVPLVQVGAFGDPERDPRTRVVTVAYLALVADHEPRPDASTPAAEAQRTGWFAVTVDGDTVVLTDEAHPDEPIEAAFDHGRILAAVVRHLRRP
jgi:serine/threonine protein kinase/ADP-ribose pyrophosphatase YjhB (NUDIX family)